MRAANGTLPPLQHRRVLVGLAADTSFAAVIICMPGDEGLR